MSLPHGNQFFRGGLEFIDVTHQDVQDQLHCLDTSKSYGPDMISPRFLKEGSDALTNSLLQLFTMSLRLSKVPKIWKQANVVPIYKKNDQNLTANYRPVSLLSVVVKVFERIIFKYVYNFFRENFVITIYQSGFLPGMSTVTQLLEVYHYFCSAVDEGKEIRVVFLDITKAFDRVWHKGLKHKLKRCGIHGQLLDWFADYLNDRLQRVVINGQYSDWGKVGAGVPQGSVLGPLLFLLYINDIVHVIHHCKIRLFADDTCLYIEVDDRDETARLINQDLEALSLWSKNWLVSFSAAKTKTITISNKPDAGLNPSLFLEGVKIDKVSSHKYLGVHLSSNLKWKEHVDEVALKARKKLSLMIPLKMKLDRKSLEIMYNSFVLATMEYANTVWGGSPDCYISKLERIHLDGLRLITGATARSSSIQVLEECNGKTISQQINCSSLILMYKILHGKVPEYLTNIHLELQGEAMHTYNLRNRGNLRIPLCRLYTFKKSFFPRAIESWNSLSANMKSSSSLEKFRQSIKKQSHELLVLYYYGKRWPSVHHARMRMGCSKLNFDLFHNLHVVDTDKCECGATETPEHYFLQCPFYHNEREILLRSIADIMPITTNNILYGNSSYSLDINKTLFTAVHQYIIDTKRFI